MIDDSRMEPLYSGENHPIACRKVMIAIPGYHEAVIDYLVNTGETIDEYALIKTAIELTTEYSEVQRRLNQHITATCLRYKTMTHMEEYISLIKEIVTKLYNELALRQLYKQNKLPYVFEEQLGNRIMLSTKEAYLARILRELREA